MATSIQTAEAEEEAPRLFISYARTEHARVSQLAAALERGGYRVWWDAALQGGHHFAAEIDRELKAADAVIVVWTKDAIGSHWVLDEASAGRDRNCLVPVRFDETDPPLGFRQLQVIDIDDADDVQALGAIGRAVSRITGTKPPPPMPPKPLERVMGAVRVMMKDDSFSGSRRGRKADKPAWVPFAWVGVVIVFWVLSNILN